jgi:diketogulonate reductase-like aldo/keto reductase
MCTYQDQDPDRVLESMDKHRQPVIMWTHWKGEADAALSALRQWLADEGLVVVPKTATEEMHDDAAEVFHAERVKQYHDSMRLYGKMTYASWPFSERMWVAMIAAAPDALAPDSVEDEA